MRLGITATRKIGSAVVRSRCKRRIRELFRHSDAASWRWPVDLVANCRNGCDSVEWRTLEKEWARLTGSVAEALGRRVEASGEQPLPVLK